jgi:hypothetical protein
MSLQSPITGVVLQLIDGDPGDLRRSAEKLIVSGEAMERSANRLEDISEGTTDLKSEAISKVRETAGEVFPDLRKAAIRYDGTGQALKKYAEAMDKVQGAFQMCTARGGVDNYASLNTLITDIEDAHQTAATKRSHEDSAQDEVREHNGVLGIGEGTDEQKADAKSDLSDATDAREQAEEELNELWGKFDGRVTYWEDAYNDAVDEIEDAFDAADNDDNWYDTLKNVLGYVALGLGLLALVFSVTFLGPILAVLALLASVVVLGIEIYKMAAGEGDWIDLGLSIVGIIPFGRAFGSIFKGGSRLARGGVKALGKTQNSTGRGIVRTSIKGQTKRPVKTKIRGSRKTKKDIRSKNRQLEKGYQSANRRDALKRGNDYLTEADKALSGDKLKYLRYLADGGSAEKRSLATYIKDNPGALGPGALKWARQTRNYATAEDGSTLAAQFGASIYGTNRAK